MCDAIQRATPTSGATASTSYVISATSCRVLVLVPGAPNRDRPDEELAERAPLVRRRSPLNSFAAASESCALNATVYASIHAPELGFGHAFNAQSSLSPSSVRSWSTRSIVRVCGTISSASPPVATVVASAPSSPRISSTIRSTWPANP